MTPTDTTRSAQQLLQLTRFGGGLSLGAMFGLIASIESINPRIVFSLNWLVPVGFFAGGGLVWWVLGRIFSSAGNPDGDGEQKNKSLFWMLFFCLLVVGLTLAGFASALHGTPSSRLRDVIFGNAIAIWAIGFCGLMVWHFIQYFEQESSRAEKKFNEEHGIGPSKNSNAR